MSDSDIGDKTDNTMTAFFKLCGIKENKLKETLADLIEKKNPAIELDFHEGEASLRISSEAEGELSAKKILKQCVKEVKNRLGEMIYSTDENETLEGVVVNLLKESDYTLTTAESCTGGMFAARIINVAGASDVLKEGFITYSNKAKRKYLGVKKRSLDKFTAVSEQVAKEMAKGVCDNTEADCSIAITGLAGPDGGSDKHPIGQVFIGCTVNKNTVVKEYKFAGDRQAIRMYAVTEALALLRLCLLQNFSEITFGEGKKKK
ncbi:MAG: nicotinamide-nucleotide amidohydrolase family protein [Lachnospiraceae bacterium]|nr:nicotinamide-nucleotide amidohydrolase family protein [Lachnospiraceae bacterium]